MSSRLEKIVMSAQEAIIEQNESLRKEVNYYKSLIKKIDENRISEKKRLEEQIIEIHRQNYALADEVDRLMEELKKTDETYIH
jgi:predicted nuclease with TOPRIM domain